MIRISGSQARLALERLIGRVPPPRQAALARIRDPGNGDVIDEALALWFPGPHSETGEDMAELQVHGGPAVIAATFAALSATPGCRPAEPGEFTRRAFDNGKLGLTEAEGLADLIAAETPAQRRAAFRQLKGQIGDRAEAWRSRIIEALALVEARIDFSDEADVPVNLVTSALLTAQHLHDEIALILADGGHAERLREGLVVAIAGPPNAGKSTLLNRLAKREAAIVSPLPGTTRDVIEVHLDLGGYPVTLLDTAGIHVGSGPVEQEGIRRAKARAESADLVLWVTDGSAIGQAANSSVDNGLISKAWKVANKLDLAVDKLGISNESGSADSFTLSALTGKGLDRLIAALSAYAADYFAVTESSIVTRARHRRALEATAAALERALALGPLEREELIAEELRAAANTLGRLIGRIDVEDILDLIFREFCIGK